MITLDLKRASFEENEKWPLLYIVADTYMNKASRAKPLTDVQAVEFIKNTYGLKIERRTIKKYRDYLEQCFGYTFKTLRKGKYVEVPWEIDIKAARKHDFLSRFKEYSLAQGESQMITRKISIILTAQKERKWMEVGIQNYITFLNPKSRGAKRIGVRNTNLLVAPIEIFRYAGQYYLLSYAKEDRQHYIHLIKTLAIKPSSVSSESRDQDIDQIDLAAYLKKQDFIVTGPINPHAKEYNYSSESTWFESHFDGVVSVICSRLEEDSSFPCPYLLQSLKDLFGERAQQYRLEDKNAIGIYFPNDLRGESILHKNDWRCIEALSSFC